MRRCDRQRRSRFQVREMPHPRPTDHHLRANPLAFAMTSRLANAQGERIAVIKMKSLTKGKAEARKVSPGPSQEALVGLCLQDLGTKCVSFGRQANVNVVVTVLSNTLRKPAAPSTKDDKRGQSQNKKKKKNKKKGDRSRSSSRGSNSWRGLSESQGQRGKTVFLWLSCSLPDARSDDGRSRQSFDQH